MAYSSTTETFMAGARPVRKNRRTRHRADEVFPTLEPADTTRRTTSMTDALHRMRMQFDEVLENPEARNPLSRVIVYALNLVLLVLAFPVGFAMLIFNVLGGANLRTTVHVLALTGLAIALANTEAGARLLGLG